MTNVLGHATWNPYESCLSEYYKDLRRFLFLVMHCPRLSGYICLVCFMPLDARESVFIRSSVRIHGMSRAWRGNQVAQLAVTELPPRPLSITGMSGITQGPMHMCSKAQWALSTIKHLQNGSMCESAMSKRKYLEPAMSLWLACWGDRGWGIGGLQATMSLSLVTLVSYKSSSGFFADVPCRRLLQVDQANNIVASMTISV